MRVLDVFREMVLFSIAWVLVILMLQIMLLSLCVLALTENQLLYEYLVLEKQKEGEGGIIFSLPESDSGSEAVVTTLK